MISHYKKGLLAEYIAMWFLRLKCYKILEHRYKTKMGEIDIIAQRCKTIIFVEVKARQNKDIALRAIKVKNVRRIKNTAKYWWKKQISYGRIVEDECKIRYDVIIIRPKRLPLHLMDQF